MWLTWGGKGKGKRKKGKEANRKKEGKGKRREVKEGREGKGKGKGLTIILHPKKYFGFMYTLNENWLKKDIFFPEKKIHIKIGKFWENANLDFLYPTQALVSYQESLSHEWTIYGCWGGICVPKPDYYRKSQNLHINQTAYIFRLVDVLWLGIICINDFVLFFWRVVEVF